MTYTTVMATIAVLALAAAGKTSASVESSGGLKYVTKDFELVPGKWRTPKAVCPKGTNVLGGGHYNSGHYGDVIGAHSYPYDGKDRGRKPDDGWAAQLRAFGEAYPAVVYAVCTKKTLPEYEQIKSLAVPPDGARYVRGIYCDPPALSIVGAGSRGPVSVREVGGADFGPNKWEFGLVNHGDTEREVTMFAVCSNLDVEYAHATTAVNAEAQGHAEAQCPAGAPHVTGGGGGLSDSDFIVGNSAIAATQPYTFANPFDGWRVWVDNYGDFSSDIYMTAICVPSL